MEYIERKNVTGRVIIEARNPIDDDMLYDGDNWHGWRFHIVYDGIDIPAVGSYIFEHRYIVRQAEIEGAYSAVVLRDGSSFIL